MIPYPSENVKRNLPLPPTRHNMLSMRMRSPLPKSLIPIEKISFYIGHNMPYNGLIG